MFLHDSFFCTYGKEIFNLRNETKKRKRKNCKLTVAFELVVRDILDDRIFQSWRVVTVSNDAGQRRFAFPQPSGEPREMTITRQRIALHVAENAEQFIRLLLIMRALSARNIFYGVGGRGGGRGMSTWGMEIPLYYTHVIINESVSLSR